MSNTYTAVLFDMDGVIFDSERIYMECCIKAAEKFGAQNVEDVVRKCIGVTNEMTIQILRESFGEDFPVDDYWKASTGYFWEFYNERGSLPMKEGVVEALTYLKEKGYLLAIASSTKTETVTRQLTDAGIVDFFTLIVGGNMVSRSKPAPDIFLKATELLKVEPEKCLVIEDSYNGIRAAYAAGIPAVMVPDLLPPTEETREKTVAILPSLLSLVEEKW